MSKIWTGVLLAVVAFLMAGCASTPQAPRESDSEAKQFLTHPNASTIYVYRSEFDKLGDEVILYGDQRLVGQIPPATYFRIDTTPGRHVLQGMAADQGRLPLETRAGDLYFVELTFAAGQSHFRLMPDEAGRKRILECCVLLENWAPGQRPFLK